MRASARGLAPAFGRSTPLLQGPRQRTRGACQVLRGTSQSRSGAPGTTPGALRGHLERAGDTQEFTVHLTASQEATCSVSDYVGDCRLELQVFAPQVMAYFDPDPIVRWQNGAATNNSSGNREGVGGHITAMLEGDYRAKVRNLGPYACEGYRLAIARSNFQGPAMPTW